MGRKQRGKKVTGLGRSLVKDQRKQRKNPRVRRNANAVDRHVAEIAHSSDRLGSVVQRNDLDEFLINAMLAGRDFTAQRESQVLVIGEVGVDAVDPSRQTVANFEEMYDYEHVSIPRRPAWDSTTTPEELDRMEKESYLKWRRGIADMEEASGNCRRVTPFEKNLEVWRQLWRVIERSDLIVQIVDARNPLLYRCSDLEAYVGEIDRNKMCLIVVNKADYLSPHMRKQWAEYLQKTGIDFVFFSAHTSQEVLNEAEKTRRQLESERLQEQYALNPFGGLDDEDDEDEDEDEDEDDESEESDHSNDEESDHDKNDDNNDDSNGNAEDIDDSSEKKSSEDDSFKVLTRSELLDYFLLSFKRQQKRHSAVRGNARPLLPHSKDGRLTVGCVGYPNVGKSSIINVLVGQKKVSVASTPGKTKNFQTLMIERNITLCDCPGLVFPTFMNSAANLVCSGVLPIDQMRDHRPAVALLCHRISKSQLEDRYSLSFPQSVRGSAVHFQVLLDRHASMRGFFKDQGRPDDSRSSRILLKDLINGVLVYCHPPPHLDEAGRVAFYRSLQWRRNKNRVNAEPQKDRPGYDTEDDANSNANTNANANANASDSAAQREAMDNLVPAFHSDPTADLSREPVQESDAMENSLLGEFAAAEAQSSGASQPVRVSKMGKRNRRRYRREQRAARKQTRNVLYVKSKPTPTADAAAAAKAGTYY